MAQNCQEISTHQHTRQQDIIHKIILALDSLDYHLILITLHETNKLPAAECNNIKTQCIPMFTNHLHKIYNFQSQTDPTPTYDLDTFLQIFSQLSPTQSPPSPYSTSLSHLLHHSLTEDIRYTFIIYRSKYIMIGEGENDEGHWISRINFIKLVGIFLEGMLGRCQGLFEDFLNLGKEVREGYQGVICGGGDLMANGVEEHQELNFVYLEYCNQLLAQSEKISAQLTTANRQKLYKFLSSSISLAVSTLQSNSPQITQQLTILNKHIQNLLQSNPNPLSPVSLSTTPPTFLLHLLKSPHYLTLLSHKNYLYILYKLLCELSPASTIGSRVGTIADKMELVLQEVVKNICGVLLDVKDGCWGVEVEGERVWVGEEEWVDLVEVYRRIAIYSGFISSQFSKQCSEAIKAVLNLKSRRYEECPILPIKIWQNMLQKADDKQIAFRIMCITQYRKLLVSHKPKLIDNSFENHSYHCHGSIFIEASKRIQKQIVIILGLPDQNLHYDYIGHLISFISNWLVPFKLYIYSYKIVNHVEIMLSQRQKIRKQCSQLAQKIRKSMDIERTKQNAQLTDAELIIFRLQALENQFQ